MVNHFYIYITTQCSLHNCHPNAISPIYFRGASSVLERNSAEPDLLSDSPSFRCNLDLYALRSMGLLSESAVGPVTAVGSSAITGGRLWGGEVERDG
jgi:hypothetical protein